MHIITIAYPGDPPKTAFLMFGKDFLEKVRGGKPAEMKITASGGGKPPEITTYLIHEIICDLCNSEILPEHPLALTDVPSRVYCWDCHRKYHEPYMVRK